MPELIALILICVSLLPKRSLSDHWRVVGIGLDGCIIEECSTCTRVRVFMIDRDGEPLGIVEIEKSVDESAEHALLRVYREQNGDNDIDIPTD